MKQLLKACTFTFVTATLVATSQYAAAGGSCGGHTTTTPPGETQTPECPYTVTFTDSSSHKGSVDFQAKDNTNTLIAGEYVNVQAYSDAGADDDLDAENFTYYSGNGIGINNYEDHDYYYGGWRDSHTIDNQNSIDSVLLSFGEDVSILDIELGYIGGDADFTLLQFNGDNLDLNALSNLSYTELLSNSWSLVGQYTTDKTSGSETFSINAGSSTYYLLSALNPNLGATNGTAGDDYFKLLSMTYCPTPDDETEVPAPATLLLLMAGLPLLRRMRRKA